MELPVTGAHAERSLPCPRFRLFRSYPPRPELSEPLVPLTNDASLRRMAVVKLVLQPTALELGAPVAGTAVPAAVTARQRDPCDAGRSARSGRRRRLLQDSRVIDPRDANLVGAAITLSRKRGRA
jgi:hypothetical protein